MAGAEGERGFDLDTDAIVRNAYAVVRTVHDKAAGFDRLQSRQTLAHPIGRLHRSELQRGRSFRAGNRSHGILHRLLFGFVAKMDRNLPAPAARIGQADGDILKPKALGDVIGDSLRGF